jgi:hypothetical protein
MHLHETATIWETLWTVPSVFGLLVRAYLLLLVFGDWRYQRRKRKRDGADNEPELIWGGSQVWQKVTLTLVLVVTTIFGAMAMLSPPTVVPAPPPTRVTYTLTVAMVIIPLLLTVDAIQVLVARYRTRAADAERQIAELERKAQV